MCHAPARREPDTRRYAGVRLAKIREFATSRDADIASSRHTCGRAWA
jgi:hypothetical protein